METIIQRNVIMLIIGIILVVLRIRQRKSEHFAASFSPGLFVLMCSVLFMFTEPYRIRTLTRTDCHILKTDTQYIVNVDGKNIENIPVKEDLNKEEYTLEITEKINFIGMILETEYTLHVPTTATVIQKRASPALFCCIRLGFCTCFRFQ